MISICGGERHECDGKCGSCPAYINTQDFDPTLPFRPDLHEVEFNSIFLKRLFEACDRIVHGDMSDEAVEEFQIAYLLCTKA